MLKSKIFSCAILLFFVFAATSVAKSPPTPEATETDIKNRNAVAFPVWRLHQDWMYQDHGQDHDSLDVSRCFKVHDSNLTEEKMVRNVLDELRRRGIDVTGYEKELDRLLQTKQSGMEPGWKELYLRLCGIRRTVRLSAFDGRPRQYVYAKHHVFGDSQAMFMMTTHLTDADFRERGPDYQVGSELCMMTISGEGKIATEVLLDCPTGVLRDPCVSFDGKRIAFSMRKNDVDDDFHLYVMELADRSVRQITFGAGTADMEPCYLPNGGIVFESTRGVQSAPCWWSNVTNLYTCDGEGRYIRRLGFDHAHSMYPSLLSDGRITYTRWEYADRVSGSLHPAMVMNWDGTNQTEYYGNNSYIPTALTHLRGIPGTQKSVGIMTGHHVAQHGKLMMIDRTKGTQENQGLKYVCPEREMVQPKIDMFQFASKGGNTYGYYGDQYQYPWSLDEENYLASYLPEPPIIPRMYPRRGPYPNKFGIYWMGIAGERELLIYDPTISSGQVFPLGERDAPPMRPTQVDQDKEHGTFYVQDVYHGPAMEGVRRGDVKRLRVVGLDGRAASTTQIILHPTGGRSTTGVAINNGTYDVKHVLGTVDVEDDGSVCFNVPARTPVYFQLLNEKGHLVQTMRSWTVLQPGETISCVGCHEDKNTSFIGTTISTKAIQKAPKNLTPFFKEGERPVQEQLGFMTPSERRALEYLGINAPQGEDVPRGFSYRREIQPILDRHCISCHAGNKNLEKGEVPMSLLGDSKPYDHEYIKKHAVFRDTKRDLDVGGNRQVIGRDFSESYLNLTDYGLKNELVNFLNAYSPAEMIPPYSHGSSVSRIMDYLEPSHYGVRVSQEEKERIACWIDLLVPYCGSWMEANTWDEYENRFWHRNKDQLRGVYLYNEMKRLRSAEVELDHLDKYKEFLATGKKHAPEAFARMEFGGWDTQKKFLEDFKTRDQRTPIHGIASGKDSRGGVNVEGNPMRNLALNPKAATHRIRSYPHVSSNSHHKYRAEYSPKNLIDGDVSPNAPSWRPDPRTDLWVKIDFGRGVLIEKIVLRLKKIPDVEKSWTSATLEFSDGKKIPITLRHTDGPQEFSFPVVETTFVRLSDLKQSFPLADCGIVQLEVFGKDRGP